MDPAYPTEGKWTRVTKSDPCPICNHDGWCSVGDVMVHCMRVEGPRTAKNGEGWLHRRPDSPPIDLALPSPQNGRAAKAQVYWAGMAKGYANQITDEQVQQLADRLGVEPNALRELGIGYGQVPGGANWRGPFTPERYTFPMFGGDGTVCGIRTRNAITNEKRALKSSRNGVFRRRGPGDGTLLVCEGESDTAAALSLGFDAIGRPGVTSCADIAATYARDRDVVAVLDNDDPRKVAIVKGVKALLASLVATAKSLRVIRPPPKHKDLRAWLQAGLTSADVQGAIDAAHLLTAENLAAFLATRAVAASSRRAVVVITTGELREAITNAETALLAATHVERIYQRGTQLVRVARLDETMVAPRGTSIPIHAPIITGVLPTFLRALLEQAAEFKNHSDSGNPETVSCPSALVKGYIESVGLWRVPILRAVVTSPTLRTDGSVLQTPGYDAESRLLYDPCGSTFPAIADNPTLDDARAAVARVLALVKGFPFVDEGARSVWLTSLLTAMVRAMLPAAPMFAFDAPTRGSGKTKLANTSGVIATGRPPATMTLVDDADETRKRITALLLRGVPVVNVDNVDVPLGGAAFCSVLTEPTYCDRILGVSEIVNPPTTTTWLATGNNLVIAGDMTRRILVCRLDPRCERPEDRRFDFDPVAVAERNRPALVSDVLTILRAHAVAGRPQCGTGPFGSFEAWSEVVRAAIVWVGLTDPIAGRQAVVEQDGGAAAMAELLRTWHAQYRGLSMTTRQVLDKACPDLQNAVDELIGADLAPGNRGRRLGQVLAQWRDRIVGGYQAIRGKDAHGGTGRWSVVRLGSPSPDGGNGGNGGNPGANGVFRAGAESTEGSDSSAKVPTLPTVPTTECPLAGTSCDGASPAPSLWANPAVGTSDPDDGLPEKPGGRRRRNRPGTGGRP